MPTLFILIYIFYFIMALAGFLILYYVLKTAIKNGIKEALEDKSVSIIQRESVADKSTI